MEIPSCQVCRSVEPVILHTLPHRGALAVLCTACVLRHHTGSFCPLCFDVYEDATNNKRPSAHSAVMCHRCPALVHRTCVASARPSSTFGYLCPQCSSPSFSFFDFRPDDCASNGSSPLVVNRDLSKQLLCAATIAAVTLEKAAAVARADADRKVREALLARKRAKEAIERVAYLIANQQMEDDSDLDDE